jgi:pilus assembly protein CpaE
VAQEADSSLHPATGEARKLRVLLFADADNGAQIRAALQATEEPLDIHDADIAARPEQMRDPTDVVMFVFTSDRHPARIPAPGAELGKTPVRIALMKERAPQAVRAALRAGADEVLFLPVDQGELARALLKISEVSVAPQPGKRGRLISLVSVTGGAGVTTIASNCALALSHATDKKVALVDLDFQSGDLDAALNLEPEHSIVSLAETKIRLNSVQVESALTKHPSGIYLLAAPRKIEESEQIPSARVTDILSMLLEMVDVVIVDIGRHINDSSVTAWENSDQIVYVIDQSIGAIRGAWRFLDLFGRLNLSNIAPRIVLNRWVAHHPISEKHITNTLGRPLAGRLPRDDDAVRLVLTRGEDLWKVAPRSALTHAYEALASELCGLAQKKSKTGLFNKLFPFARNGKNSRR